MGPNGPAFPCRVGRVVLSYFEDRPELALRVVLSLPGLDFERFLVISSSLKIEIENH